MICREKLAALLKEEEELTLASLNKSFKAMIAPSMMKKSKATAMRLPYKGDFKLKTNVKR